MVRLITDLQNDITDIECVYLRADKAPPSEVTEILKRMRSRCWPKPKTIKNEIEGENHGE